MLMCNTLYLCVCACLDLSKCGNFSLSLRRLPTIDAYVCFTTFQLWNVLTLRQLPTFVFAPIAEYYVCLLQIWRKEWDQSKFLEDLIFPTINRGCRAFYMDNLPVIEVFFFLEPGTKERLIFTNRTVLWAAAAHGMFEFSQMEGSSE